jgi:hypothetical protein
MYNILVKNPIGSEDIIEGESFERLNAKLGFLDQDEKNELVRSSKTILKHCIPSSVSNTGHKYNDTTGLVFGYVQSGKTLSFTSVMALARDNDYRVAILIAGRTNLLLSQNTNRLLTEIGDDRKISVTTNESDPDFVRKIDKSFRNLTGKLLIITVLKHQLHIKNLAILFRDKRLKESLMSRSVLIFDDESDQASLNTEARKNSMTGSDNQSAIFASIQDLRRSIPNNSYIQYTATPQANLLIDYLDLLSPQWHVLLEPGKNYTGGMTFFKEPLAPKLIYNIPEDEQFHWKNNPLKKPPKGLIESIYKFIFSSVFLCYEDFDLISDVNLKKLNRSSMMVHPCYRKDSIGLFVKWVKLIIEGIQKNIDNNNLSYIEKKYLEYVKEYQWIFNSLPDFNEVIRVINDDFLASYTVHEVIGGMEKIQFPWSTVVHHILVGGQLLDRGFTVENLLVTYMPRDTAGINNADTIEQRCRFFGYKKDYINLCEVYLPLGLRVDYESYVDHEINLREVLSKVTLSEFKKVGSPMLSSSKLNLTNKARIGSGLRKDSLNGFKYFEPPLNILKENEVVEEFLSEIQLRNPGTKLWPKIVKDQTPDNKHMVYKVDIDNALYFLSKLDLGNSDERIKLSTYERHVHWLKDTQKSKFVWVIQIAEGRKEGRERTISFDENETFKNPYSISSLASNFPAYWGDTKLLQTDETGKIEFDFNDELIIQIHKIKAMNDCQDIKKNQYFYSVAFNFSKKQSNVYISKILK